MKQQASDSSSRRPLSRCIVRSRPGGEGEYVHAFGVYFAVVGSYKNVFACARLFMLQLLLFTFAQTTADSLLLTKDHLPALFASYRKRLSGHL